MPTKAGGQHRFMLITDNSNLLNDAAADAGTHTERRIAWLTLVFGLLAGLAATAMRNRMWAGGLIIGAVLAWFNFRWLRKGLDALVVASTAQARDERPQVPVATYFRALLRYALLGLCAYVIFKVLRLPLASMIVGMCSLAAAAIAASVYEVARGRK